MMSLKEMSGREKSLWVELMVDVVVAAYYFPKMFALINSGDEALMAAPMTALVFKTVGLAITCAIAMTIILSLLGLKGEPEKADERDKEFSAKGYIGGFWVLSVCIAGLMGQIIFGEMFAESGWYFFAFSPVIIAHLLLVALMLSSTAKSVIQLYFYRRGY